ncbi:hypothetical protein L195_g015522, partial [Trifolium pratense]
RWRIGSGDNIHVMYDDPWLNGSDNRRVSSPQPAADVVERILATPFVGSVREDKVVLEEERNGCYSVKSGYKLTMHYIIRSDKYHVWVTGMPILILDLTIPSVAPPLSSNLTVRHG